MTLHTTPRREIANAVVLVALAAAVLVGGSSLARASSAVDPGYDYGSESAFVRGAGPAGYSAGGGDASGSSWDYVSAEAFAHGAGPAGYAAK